MLADQTTRWAHSTSPRQTTAEQRPPSTENSAVVTSSHQPPLPVRIALVSTTTALATPSFPALGFLYLVLRVTVPNADLRKAMEGRWGALLSFTTWTLLPKLYQGSVASLILPFSVGNAVAAGAVYGAVDVACGGPSSGSPAAEKILRNPLIAGAGIGATVGYVAPNYLYGPILERLYAMEGMSQSMQYVMGMSLATEVSVVTGAVAGIVLHPLLYYPMNGVQGVHWGVFSGTALAAATSALVYVYYGRQDVGLPVPEGSFVDPAQLDFIDAIVRYNPASGEAEAYSPNQQRFVGSLEEYTEGQRTARASRSYAEKGKAVFNDRLLAFVYNYWDKEAGERYPDRVVHIKAQRECQREQEAVALTDAAVAVILRDTVHGTDKNETSGRAIDSSGAMATLTTIDELGSSSEGKTHVSSKLKKLEDSAIAIELLILARKSEQEHASQNVPIPTLERFVRERCPELVLYTSEERHAGESIESQLQGARWQGPEISQAMDRWERVHKKVTRRRWKNRVIFLAKGAAAGLLLSVAGTLLQGTR